MNPVSLLLSLLLAGFFSATTLFSKPASKQTLRFLLVTGTELQLPGAPPPPKVDFYIAIDGEHKQLVLSPGEISEPVARPTTNGIEALREVSPAKGAGQPAVYAPITSADFPASWDQVLVVVATTPDGQSFRVLGIDPAPEGEKTAQLSILNLTYSSISANLGTSQTTLAPLGQASLALPGSPTEAAMYLFRVAVSRNSVWHLDVSRMLVLDPKNPRMALILPESEGRVKLMLLDPLFAPPPAPAPAAKP